MWKALFIFTVTIVISFYTTSAKESVNGEKELVYIASASTTENSLINSHEKLDTSKVPIKPHFETEMIHVTYDQRQEGQYNVRADLENFLIVVVPNSKPIAGINLIDLLTRSSVKRSNSKKGHKKHHILSKTNPSDKSEGNLNYQPRQQYSEESQPSEYYEYIEGRTPYRVDISSDIEFSKAGLNPLVEVFSPAHPDSHLMKSHHLGTEPRFVQNAAMIPPKQA